MITPLMDFYLVLGPRAMVTIWDSAKNREPFLLVILMLSGLHPKDIGIIGLVVAARMITLKFSLFSTHRLHVECKVAFAVCTVISKHTFKLLIHGLLRPLVHPTEMPRKAPAVSRHIGAFIMYGETQCDSSILHSKRMLLDTTDKEHLGFCRDHDVCCNVFSAQASYEHGSYSLKKCTGMDVCQVGPGHEFVGVPCRKPVAGHCNCNRKYRRCNLPGEYSIHGVGDTQSGPFRIPISML